MNTKSIFSNIRLSKALIGMSQSEFEALIPVFTASWKTIHKSVVKKRCQATFFEAESSLNTKCLIANSSS